MTPLERLRLFLLASDPGRINLRVALRVAGTLAAVCVVLIALDRWVHMPVAAFTLGMISAIQGAAQIRDPTVSGRAVTRAYAAFGGFLVIAAITLVERSLLRIDLLLLAVVFVTTYVRRFGIRWQAVGVFTFMCGVVGAFLKAPETDLGKIALALAISGFTAHLIGSVVMPEVLSVDFRRVVSATVSLSRQLRQAIMAAQRSSGSSDHREVRRIGGGLRNAILMCESYLPPRTDNEDADLETRVGLRFLDLQLAAETSIELCLPDGGSRRGSQAADLQTALEDLRQSEEAIEAGVKRLPVSFPEKQAVKTPAQKAAMFPLRGEWFKDESLRLSLQVTLACAIAMAGGELLSSERWFWAVMTAFLIFMNAQSGGAVAARAVDRSLGTAAGIVLGIVLAATIHGNPYWTIPLVAMAIFAAFYTARLSYIFMTVCINITIALIYGFVGIFTPELLVLRLEETAVGAAAGIFVALLILPVSAVRKAKESMDRLIRALLGMIENIVDRKDNISTGPVAGAVNAVDRAYSDVLAAFEPLKSTWSIGSPDAKTAEALRQAYLMTHAAHLLQHGFRNAPPNSYEAQLLRMIRDRLEVVEGENKPNANAVPDLVEAMRIEKQERGSDDRTVRYAVETLLGVLQYLEAANDGNRANAPPKGA